MERRMEPIVVRIEEGVIEIVQEPLAPGENEQIIVIAPEQIDILIKWLQEAKIKVMPE